MMRLLERIQRSSKQKDVQQLPMGTQRLQTPGGLSEGTSHSGSPRGDLSSRIEPYTLGTSSQSNIAAAQDTRATALPDTSAISKRQLTHARMTQENPWDFIHDDILRGPSSSAMAARASSSEPPPPYSYTSPTAPFGRSSPNLVKFPQDQTFQAYQASLIATKSSSLETLSQVDRRNGAIHSQQYDKGWTRGQVGAIAGKDEGLNAELTKMTVMDDHKTLSMPRQTQVYHSTDQDIILPEDDIRSLFQECVVAKNNAQVLHAALLLATPSELDTDLRIKKFHERCRASQELILAQIPWAKSGAERSKVAAANERAAKESGNDSQGNSKLLQRPQAVAASDSAADLTREQRLLAVLLSANQKLIDVFRVFEELKKLAIAEMEGNEFAHRSRVETEMDRTQTPFYSLAGAVVREESGNRAGRSDFARLPSPSVQQPPSGRHTSITSAQSVDPAQKRMKLPESRYLPLALHLSNDHPTAPTSTPLSLPPSSDVYHPQQINAVSSPLQPHSPSAPFQTTQQTYHDHHTPRYSHTGGYSTTMNEPPDTRTDDKAVTAKPGLEDAAEEAFIQSLVSLEELMRQNVPRELTGEVDIPDYRIQEHGGLAVVYRGTWGDRPIAVKVLKARRHRGKGYGEHQEFSLERRLTREITVWAALNHPNIIELLGFANGFGDFAAMISPWCEHGTATDYLGKTDLTVQERLQLARDVAAGLHYLHGLKIIHGDLKPINVLVDDAGVARLCDFGLVRLADWEGPAGMTTTTLYTGTERYKAPELFISMNNRNPVATFKGDIYSLGCILLEFIEQRHPFQRFPRAGQLRDAILDGESPALPRESTRPLGGWTEFFWELLEVCWSSPMERPTSKVVVSALGSYALGLSSTS